MAMVNWIILSEALCTADSNFFVQVRRDKGEIDLQIINEVMDKKVLGSAASRLPESAAKRQLALISAARAVVIALTPGMPQIQRVTIRPRGEALSRTLFMPQVMFLKLVDTLSLRSDKSPSTEEKIFPVYQFISSRVFCQSRIWALLCTLKSADFPISCPYNKSHIWGQGLKISYRITISNIPRFIGGLS